MNTNEVTGYNEERMNAVISEIKSAFSELITTLGTTFETQFVKKLENEWFCQEAIEFGTALKAGGAFTDGSGHSFDFGIGWDKLLKSVNDVYEHAVNALNTYGTAWGNETKNGWNKITFIREDKTISIDFKKTDATGTAGVKETDAYSTIEKLVMIENDALNAVKRADSYVKEGCGLLGRNQPDAVAAGFDELSKNINNLFGMISTEGKVAVKNSVARYGELGQAIAQINL